jgi:hypothetical protein
MGKKRGQNTKKKIVDYNYSANTCEETIFSSHLLTLY